MAAPYQEAIETFISITGASESVAAQKLQEHGGDLNAAVNAHFNEGDRSNTRQAPVAAPPNDYMEIDDPVLDGIPRPPLPLLSSARTTNPFSLLDSNFTRLFDDGSDITNRAPLVTHPREVREIPIEVKDSNEPSGHSGRAAPTIVDVTEIADTHGPVTHGTVILDDDEDDDVSETRQTDQISHERRINPSAPAFDNMPDYNNDIEEEMVRAVIEASKRETEGSIIGEPHHHRHLGDTDLADAVSLSMKTAEQEKTFREQWPKPGESSSKTTEVELKDLTSSNGRLEVGSSSVQDDAEDLEEQPLVRHRSRRLSFGSMEYAKEEVDVDDDSPPSSPRQHVIRNPPQHNANAFPSDEWGGISSLEHDEAVMLEAAMFGGVPDENRYQYAFAPHQLMQNSSTYARPIPRPPSPTLEAQRLIREQQDDEYLASLQADIEKAEARRLEEEAARQAALEEERRKEEETRHKFEEEQELERRLAAKEASLPQEPASDDENAVNLLVRMPDGSRPGRRFLKSDRLQSLFDFIDIGRNVKPDSYRLVRPYPRQTFGDGESGLTLNELGLTSRQEALFLESI